MKNSFKLILAGGLFLLILAVVVFAVNLSNSPSACSGQWTNCSNAFADNSNRATASVSSSVNKTGTWNNYGFSISDSATIDQVVIRADFFASNVRGYINVRVSGDGGATFGPSHVVGGNTAEQTFNIDVTADTSWTPAKLNNSNLRVNVTCFKQGSGSNPTCRLDWIPVNVTYTPFDLCTRANPTVLISPDTQNGSAGSQLNYTTNVTNNDSNDCGSSVFSMTKSIPSGWTGVFVDNSLTINPGSSKSTTFMLTSLSNATAGDYAFNNTATNSNSSSFKATDSAIYHVN